MEKYDHQRIEEWLLAEQQLDAAEHQALKQHLQSCPECQRLAVAWNQVRLALRAAPHVAPERDFTARWRVRQAAVRRRQHRRQTLLILAGVTGGAAFLFLLLGLLVLPLLAAPRPALLMLLYQLSGLFSAAGDAASIFSTLVRAVYELVPPTMWVGLGVAAAGLMTVWLAALLRLARAGRVNVWNK